MSFKKIFLNISFGFLFYLSILVALAIFGYFTFYLILGVTLIFLLFSLLTLILGLPKINFKNLNRSSLICFCLIIAFSLIIGIFHHDLPFGRDDLSYIYSASILTKSHSLEWDDYFSRPTHGVRNLGADTFTSQFLPLYPCYLAVYYFFGGIKFLFWANVFLMILSFLSIYYLMKNLAGENSALWALLFFFSSYIFYWFPKRTNVENIFLFLIWFGLFLLVEALNKKNPHYLLGGMVSFSLLPLARAEGIIFFIFYCLVAFILYIIKLRKVLKRKLSALFFSISFIIFNFLLFYLYLQRYKAGYILKQIIDVLEEFDFILNHPSLIALLVLLLLFIVVSLLIARKKQNLQKYIFWLILGILVSFELVILFLSKTGKLTWDFYRSQYVLESFTYYFYFLYLLLILLGLRKKVFQEKEFWLTLILLPAFFFIIEPNIALDHPWFLRRFYPNLIPLLFILAAISLVRLNLPPKRLKLLTVLIIICSFFFSSRIMFFSEHKGIRNQLEQLNQFFPKNSLILMNPKWDWRKFALLQHYLYDLNALPNLELYRFEEFKKELPTLLTKYPNWERDNQELLAIMNWQNDQAEARFYDLLKKYNDVYVVTGEENSQFFPGFRDENLIKQKDLIFNFLELQPESKIVGYIRSLDIINLKEVRKKQGILPPYTFINQEIKFSIYKVINSQDYYPFQYITDLNQLAEQTQNFQLLEEKDLVNYRRSLKDAKREIELGVSD